MYLKKIEINIFPSEHLASLGVGARILAGAVPVVEGALVVIDALQAVLGQSVA